MAHELAVLARQIENISCIEGDPSNLFVGTTDGNLLHYVIHRDDPASDSLEYTYLLASKQDATGGKPPKAIVLLAHVQLAAVLADETLSFYTLPEFAPASDLRIVKDVRGVLLNDDVDSRVEADGSCALTVFTRKKIRQLKITRDSVKLSKDIEYLGCLTACQRGPIVCAATKSSYDLINLDQKSKTPLFPVVQGEADPSGPEFRTYRPRITSVTTDEFLVASGSPESPTTMGMFVTKEGEITRGTLMFGAYPWKLLVQHPYVFALLSNQTIEIHDINSQELVQTLQVSGAIGMTKVSEPISVVLERHMNKLIFRRNGPLDDEKPDLEDLNLARKISDVLSQVLVYAPSTVQAVVTHSTFLNVDQTLDQGDIQNGLAITEILARETRPAYAERLYHELSYIHQKAGIMYFERMLFDDAADSLKDANLDPRVLISFFPGYVSHSENANVYSGIFDVLSRSRNVDEIIHNNLSQTVDDEATLRELQDILKGNALELLRRFLTKFRDKKGFGSLGKGQKVRDVFLVVEVVLLKILLQNNPMETSPELLEFFKIDIDGPNEVIEILQECEKWQLLAELYSRQRRHRDALKIWQNLEYGICEDSNSPEDLTNHIKQYLLSYGDDDSIYEYGLWLVKHSLPVGLALFTECANKKLISFSLGNILDDLRSSEADHATFLAFLEYLVVDLKVDDYGLTNELIRSYGDRVLQDLQHEGIRTAIIRSIDEYRALPVPKVPYLTFVAEIRRVDAGDSFYNFNRMRATLIDLLQGSSHYNADDILAVVLKEKSILLAERILLYGRLSNHPDSLNLLVHDLKDFDSAEVYCYHGGISLSQIRIYSDKKETVAMRKYLFPLLFSEILKLENYSLQFIQGSMLLNRWGNYMDIAVVLEMVPDHWSVGLIGEFLESALAHLAGEKMETQIRRSLTRSQLQRTVAKTYVILD